MIAYEVPSIVKLLNDSWPAIYRTSMTVIGLFVGGIEVPLLFFFKDDSNFHRSGVVAKQALLALAYSTLFLSLSAAVTGLILTNKLRKDPTLVVLSDGETPTLSQGYEGRFIWMVRHLMLSLIGGIFLPIVQVLLYVWLEESDAVKFTLSIITLFAMLPIVFVLLPSGDGKRSLVRT
ncbi:hypothetical protein EI94DRAFT_1734406 [Lactarius quietus]|nr:hypothetical protein EI94DRAFT_1734406 [Lactarius quietus]